MASATSKAVGYIIPVVLIILILFFFLETRLGRKLLNDLKNAILVGSTDHGGSTNQNTNDLSNPNPNPPQNGGGGAGSSPPLVPPPDVSQALNPKNPPPNDNTGGGGGGGSGNPAPYTGGGTPIPGIDLGAFVQKLIPITGIPSDKTGRPNIANPFNADIPLNPLAQTATPLSQADREKLLAQLEVGVIPKSPLAPIPPTPNTNNPVTISTPPVVANTPIQAPSIPDLNKMTQIPNPLSPQPPNLLSQIEGIPQGVFNFFSQNPLFRLQPAPQEFFNTSPKVEVPIGEIPAI